MQAGVRPSMLGEAAWGLALPCFLIFWDCCEASTGSYLQGFSTVLDREVCPISYWLWLSLQVAQTDGPRCQRRVPSESQMKRQGEGIAERL